MCVYALVMILLFIMLVNCYCNSYNLQPIIPCIIFIILSSEILTKLINRNNISMLLFYQGKSPKISFLYGSTVVGIAIAYSSIRQN